MLFAVTIVTTSDPELAGQITTLFLLSFGVMAASTAAWRVNHSSGRRRRAWLSLSIGLCIAVLVNAIGVFIGLGLLGPEWDLIVNLMLMTGLCICIIGLALFPPVRRRGTDLARLIMDGLMVGASALLIASSVIFPTLLAGQDTSLFGQAQVLALPVLDLVVATMAVLLIARSGKSSRTPLLLVGVAFMLYCISDMAYAVNLSLGGYGLGSLWDLGWLGGYLLFALAALHPDARVQSTEPELETSSVRSTIVFFAIFLAGTGTSIMMSAMSELNVASRVIWGVLILTVVIRQIVLVMDNEQLRRSLEIRVLERTKELREITNQRELLLSSVADGIYGVDRDGRITMVNGATTRLLKRSESDLIGANAHDLFHAPQSDGTPYPIEGCYITEATSSGLTAAGEDDLYVRGDGKTIVIEATASPLRDDIGVISGAVVVFRDVSQRREMDRMKQEFISVVSHELRTPLTSIRGALGLIAGGAFGELPPRAAKMIDIATTGSVRLGRLVNDILEIERLDTGMLPMSIRTHEVVAACQEAVNATSGLAQAAGIGLRLGPAEGRVIADRDRLVQVLINLIGNAVRFSDPGDSVLVEARAAGELIEFAVSDTGRGIPDDKLEEIFGRFSQVDASDTREKGGSGLGLAICRGLIERMGGRIWVESVLGAGSTFRFELPASTAPATAAENDEMPVGVGASALEPRTQEG
ncbi:sensor histidine kinase [Micropruina sp.]|uniref:sensor histidine kinase n=1 Tax=Micropruina sp. TaxID=2737536 RepID=UPI0039E360F1